MTISYFFSLHQTDILQSIIVLRALLLQKSFPDKKIFFDELMDHSSSMKDHEDYWIKADKEIVQELKGNFHTQEVLRWVNRNNWSRRVVCSLYLAGNCIY